MIINLYDGRGADDTNLLHAILEYEYTSRVAYMDSLLIRNSITLNICLHDILTRTNLVTSLVVCLSILNLENM